MSANVTLLQRRILAYIGEFTRQAGYPPTVREIGHHFAIGSPGSVAYHLRHLESAGLLKRSGSVSRGLCPSEKPLGKPILGRVGAGGSVAAQEDIEGTLTPEDLDRGDFLLRVQGDSMKDAGIIEGDLVQVRRQQSAHNGDLVVALVRDQEEGVVKRLRRQQGRWVLESANRFYRPITGGFGIVGKVVGLIRRYGK